MSTQTVIGPHWRVTMEQDGLRRVYVELQATERPEPGQQFVVELPGGMRFPMYACGYSAQRFERVWDWQLASNGGPTTDEPDIVLTFNAP